MAHGAGMFNVPQTVGTILCCKCGILMQPNAANMCANCLQSEVDITEGLQKHVIIIHCPVCESYLDPPRTWLKAELESKELLTFCLQRLNKKNSVRLVCAEFIWTEPHSKRLKIKLRVQKEVLHGAILEQAFYVEYVVQDQLCESCSRAQANPDQWIAAVQLRQHVSHRRTFFYLEQLILKHDAAKHAIRIRQMDQGIDFFFGKISHGLKFVAFVGNVVPITTSRRGEKLVSQDGKSNTYNYKYTFSVEISPICREDLICLPHKLSVRLGNFGPLVICTKVSNAITLLDPLNPRKVSLDTKQYWRSSFKALLSSRQLVEYIVLDIELDNSVLTNDGSRYVLANAQVARLSDFGKNDRITEVRTHLGHILSPGDHALGYDLYGANSNDFDFDKYKGPAIPDVILIKKSYEERRQNRQDKARPWKLKSLNMEIEEAARGKDHEEKKNSEYEQFLRDLEENPDLRFNLSLYHNKDYQPSEVASMTDGEDVPTVPLDELLAELELGDDEDDGDDDDDDMSDDEDDGEDDDDDDDDDMRE